jgi:hypothetical protein
MLLEDKTRDLTKQIQLFHIITTKYTAITNPCIVVLLLHLESKTDPCQTLK